MNHQYTPTAHAYILLPLFLLQSERLHANWYSKASDLTEMAELEARSLAVPVRFLVTLREGLAESAKTDGNTLNAVPDKVSNEPVSGYYQHDCAVVV